MSGCVVQFRRSSHSTVELQGCMIAHNSASSSGGGLFFDVSPFSELLLIFFPD